MEDEHICIKVPCKKCKKDVDVKTICQKCYMGFTCCCECYCKRHKCDDLPDNIGIVYPFEKKYWSLIIEIKYCVLSGSADNIKVCPYCDEWLDGKDMRKYSFELTDDDIKRHLDFLEDDY